ncbi:MAG: TetR/AcrR family transcriptional regulator [Actinomycetota bacterium]|nr:TetR/AcrR family transcriptional regulator [Actinomycetota bacterium]
MDSHRRQVNDAILDATAQLIAEHGPFSVAMSAIAERAQIGRATLYKYFPDVESILLAWHARHFAEHLNELKSLTEAEKVTLQDLTEFIHHQRRHSPSRNGADVLGTLAHTLAWAGGVPGGAIEDEIVAVLTRLLTRLGRDKEVRDDEDPQLLARWLLHASHAPNDLADRAVSQLVADSLAPRAIRRRAGRAVRPVRRNPHPEGGH